MRREYFVYLDDALALQNIVEFSAIKYATTKMIADATMKITATSQAAAINTTMTEKLPTPTSSASPNLNKFENRGGENDRKVKKLQTCLFLTFRPPVKQLCGYRYNVYAYNNSIDLLKVFENISRETFEICDRIVEEMVYVRTEIVWYDTKSELSEFLVVREEGKKSLDN